MALTWPFKDPDEVLDYTIDWSDRLGEGDAVDTSTWFVPSGLTQENEEVTTTTTVLWLSGGTLGQTYTILNRITTTGGRTMDQSVNLKIKTK